MQFHATAAASLEPPSSLMERKPALSDEQRSRQPRQWFSLVVLRSISVCGSPSQLSELYTRSMAATLESTENVVVEVVVDDVVPSALAPLD